MSTISSVGNAGSTWTDLSSSRASARKDKMFAKADANGDGTVGKTELQDMLDRISSKTGTAPLSADDLMSKMDTDGSGSGSGSLGKDELANGMKSLMPPPASTVDFAQQHATDASSTGSSSDATATTAAADAAGANKAEGHHHHHGPWRRRRRPMTARRRAAARQAPTRWTPTATVSSRPARRRRVSSRR